MRDATFGEIRSKSAMSLYEAAKATAKAVADWRRAYCIRLGLCPFCLGKLSETRIQNGRQLRHCYSCHFEFFLPLVIVRKPIVINEEDIQPADIWEVLS